MTEQTYTVHLRGANVLATEVVRPGDILIVNTDMMSDTDVDETMEILREHAPGVRGIVVQGARSIHVMRRCACGKGSS